MKESCKKCRYFIDKYQITLPLGINIQTIELNTNNIKCITYCEENEAGTGICDNQFSPYYQAGINSCNTCDYFSNKDKNSKKLKDVIDKKTELDVFDKYECEGQLSFEFIGDKVEIKSDN